MGAQRDQRQHSVPERFPKPEHPQPRLERVGLPGGWLLSAAHISISLGGCLLRHKDNARREPKPETPPQDKVAFSTRRGASGVRSEPAYRAWTAASATASSSCDGADGRPGASRAVAVAVDGEDGAVGLGDHLDPFEWVEVHALSAVALLLTTADGVDPGAAGPRRPAVGKSCRDGLGREPACILWSACLLSVYVGCG